MVERSADSFKDLSFKKILRMDKENAIIWVKSFFSKLSTMCMLSFGKELLIENAVSAINSIL